MKRIALRNGNWGLKLLALILAIIIYNTLKTGTIDRQKDNDRTILKSP